MGYEFKNTHNTPTRIESAKDFLYKLVFLPTCVILAAHFSNVMDEHSNKTHQGNLVDTNQPTITYVVD
jgi:hypothetical protein